MSENNIKLVECLNDICEHPMTINRFHGDGTAGDTHTEVKIDYHVLKNIIEKYIPDEYRLELKLKDVSQQRDRLLEDVKRLEGMIDDDAVQNNSLYGKNLKLNKAVAESVKKVDGLYKRMFSAEKVVKEALDNCPKGKALSDWILRADLHCQTYMQPKGDDLATTELDVKSSGLRPEDKEAINYEYFKERSEAADKVIMSIHADFSSKGIVAYKDKYHSSEEPLREKILNFMDRINDPLTTLIDDCDAFKEIFADHLNPNDKAIDALNKMHTICLNAKILSPMVWTGFRRLIKEYTKAQS